MTVSRMPRNYSPNKLDCRYNNASGNSHYLYQSDKIPRRRKRKQTGAYRYMIVSFLPFSIFCHFDINNASNYNREFPVA